MKVILIKEVKSKGKKGDTIEVPNGYGNFLIKNKSAIEATTSNLEKLQKEQQLKVEREKQLKVEMEQLKVDIESKTLVLKVKTGNGGRVFGAVSTKQIVSEFENKFKIKLDKKKIKLKDGIKSLGFTNVPIQLHNDVMATIKVQVIE